MPTSHSALAAATAAGRRFCRHAALPALALVSVGSHHLHAATPRTATAVQTEPKKQQQDNLTAMLRDAGIKRLYKDLVQTVLTESRQARQACNDSSIKADTIEQFVVTALDAQQMTMASVNHLSTLVEPAIVDQVSDWMTSPAGQMIMAAESSSADWSDEEFIQREQALAYDADWNESRQKLLLQVIDASTTVTFVAALHTETTALVLQTGDCIASDESRLQLNQTLRQAQNDEAFHGMLLREDIHRTAGMIFSNIGDEDLEAYLAHSQSVAGIAWNEALLESIRTTLRDRHVPIQQFLATDVRD